MHTNNLDLNNDILEKEKLINSMMENQSSSSHIVSDIAASFDTDLKQYKTDKKDKAKAELYESVYASEINNFRQRHRRFPNRREKRSMASDLKRMITKGDIRIDEHGQIALRGEAKLNAANNAKQE